ncbi:MAG: hypothetical protein K0R46_2821 [Herbinix sp.]|jgi:hypothetical protein|nr:hypothetical protein [Herbinix sp.]
MAEDRIELIKKIEEMRKSKVLIFFTGDRSGLETQIANDATNYFSEQLDKIGVVPKITLFLYTNGGNTLAGWNIVNLIRQFCDDFEIIVPSKARSTGTLMCLGANRIIMTKQATLGPIDPSVTMPLNPQIPGGSPEAKVPVSVEAIKGFFELAKHELGITDQNALSSIFLSLTEKVHPIVLGEVYRAIGQIQMLAEKLLKNQVTEPNKIEKIISFLCSESGSHDYTINRREAANNLGLNIEKPDDDLYLLIKGLYDNIKLELQISDPYSPNLYLGQEQEKGYDFIRLILQSIDGGKDAFVSAGRLSKVIISQSPLQFGINDQRNYEGWRHINE